MARAVLEVPQRVKEAIWAHLLPRRQSSEEAAFMFVRHQAQDEGNVFEYLDWYGVPPEGFLVRSSYHFELRDETRARVIKEAHELEASLVEFHSHMGHWPAAFSESDLLGFEEFVPHVWWRLRGRPYLAVVVTRKDFDSLIWLDSPESPQHLDGIVVQGCVLKPTQLSPLGFTTYEP